MFSKKPFISIFISLSCIISLHCFTSCEETFSSDPSMRLSFSADTVSFDTVFSTIKSPTKRLMVKNKNNKALRISRIKLVNGATSCFQLNVDGEAGIEFKDVEISAKDSIYVFIAVLVNKLGQDAPLLVEDMLTFETNGKLQQVMLETFGQDVEIMRGKTILNDTTLTAAKPYIIYDSLSIIRGKKLTLDAGCRLYFHNNANLYVYGNLEAAGTAEKPVIMRGDRFDAMNFSPPVPYNEVAGQWGGVYLHGAGKHYMKYVNINSGYVGVFLSSLSSSAIPSQEEMPDLTIENCKLHNFLLYGLVAQNADVTVKNSVISNTGSYCVYANGGTHRFIHTTIANYFNSGEDAAQSKSRDQKEPAVMIMNLNKTAPMKTEFINCAISGNIANEFSLASRVSDKYEGIFKNTYIKRNPIELPQFGESDSIRWFEKNDVLFKSTVLDYDKQKRYNFEPDSVSPLLKLADPARTREAGLQYDLNGIDRYASEKPAAGAYEWKPEKTSEK